MKKETQRRGLHKAYYDAEVARLRGKGEAIKHRLKSLERMSGEDSQQIVDQAKFDRQINKLRKELNSLTEEIQAVLEKKKS